MVNRMLRVPEELWNAAKDAVAAAKGPRKITVHLDGDENLSEAIRKFLEKLVR